MLNRIIKFSLENRLLILIISLILLLAGTYTATRMDVDVFPDLNAPTVVVMTEAPGMAAEEVERLVTFPVETAMNGATNVRLVRSSSTAGFSIVWVQFDWDTEIFRARQIVSEKLSQISASLPANVGNPVLGPQSSILGELLIIGITSNHHSLQELRTLSDWTIRPRLLSVGGVAQATVIGGEIKEYQVLLDQGRMKYYDVSLTEVMSSVQNMTLNSSGGVLNDFGNEYIVQGILSTADVAEMEKTVVKRGIDAPVCLADIATVGIGNSTPRIGSASVEGKSAVLITVTKQPNTNSLKLTERLDHTIDELRQSLPEGVEIATNIFRQASFIESSVNNVQKALIEGALFVIVVLSIFLMNGRTTFISLTALPLSMLFAIIVLKQMGLTLNTMSLGGLAIAIGSLVDDAIVDVENVYKRLRENRRKPESERTTPSSVVFEASKEVRMPILNSTLIMIVSFLPLFFLDGMEGRMLTPLGISFIASLLASTVIALTLTPVLCSYLLTSNRALGKIDKEPFVARKLKHYYALALQWAVGHKKGVLAVTAALFVASLAAFFTLGRSFLPAFNEGSLTINVSALPGITLDESDKVGLRAEELLLSVPEIQTVARKTGRAELDEHALGVNTSEIEAPFVLNDRSREVFLSEVREKLSSMKGVNVEIGQPISHRIDAMLSGTRANVAIKIFGSDLNRLYRLGNEVKAAVADVEGIADLTVEQQIERPQLQIKPKREMLAKYGITPAEFSELVNVLLAGEAVSQVYEDGRRFNLVVKTDRRFTDNIDKLNDLIIDAQGAKIPLSHVADIVSTSGPNTINRENVQRYLVVSANIGERDLRGVVTDVQSSVAEKVTLPEGYYIQYSGQFESEAAASRILFLTSLLALIVIFLLLYQQFRSLSLSAVILLNLPLALIGGVWAVRLTSGIVSIPAIIGFISLFGIATRNGILLVSRFMHLRNEGCSVYECVTRGSSDRLNPILMTALASALALVPLAVGGDLAGNEIQSPMAKVILGGLLTSTFLNGFIVPVVYLLMYDRKKQGI